MANETELLLKLKAVDELTPIMAKAVQVMEAQTNALVATMDKLGEATHAPAEPTEHLNTGMINLASTMHVVTEAVEIAHAAWEKIEGTIEKAIEEAEAAEKAQNRLTGALVATGKYTEENVKSIEEYSEAVKAATGVADEQVKIMVAQGIQMGLNVQQSKDMELAARQMAAATGKDANEAFMLLSATLTGNSGRLAKQIPQIKDLTAAQLKNGEAARIVTAAFGEQYKLYEQSYTVSVQKAKTAVDDVYKSIGLMITQSPLVIKGIEAFAEGAKQLGEFLTVTHEWITKNGEVLINYGEAIAKAAAATLILYTAIKTIQFGSAVFEALAISIKLYGVAQTLVTNGTLIMTTVMNGLKVALASINPVYAVLIIGTAALTAAFAKWPGLFDQIVGGIKMFAGMFVESMSSILATAAQVAGVFNKDLAASLTRAQQGMQNYADKLQLAGSNQIDLGTHINETKDMTLKAVDATDKHTEALDKNLESTSKNIAANLARGESYAGILIGTQKERDALDGLVQARDKELKKFTDYLDAKKRLAISKAEEQQLQLATIQSKEVTGGGEQTAKAKDNLAIAQEQQKQAQLAILRKKGVIDNDQFNEEMFLSGQRLNKAQLDAEMSHQQALADVLGNGPAGFEMQKQIRKQKYDAETADQIANAERMDATDEQIEQLKKQRKLQQQAQEFNDQKAHDQLMIDQATQATLLKAQALGETPEAIALKQQAETQAFQMKLQQMQVDAQAQGATQAEIDSARQQAELEHTAKMTEINTQYWDHEAQLQEQSGNSWEAFLARRNSAVSKEGVVMGNLHAVTNSQYYKAEMGMLGDVANLRNSHSKKAFEAGKAAAIAQATVQTFLAATEAFAAMASIPIVGPVLGGLAAAAAVASGLVQIQSIKSQQFQGGQADSGMNSVPQNLDGKSFVLSAGERVVQPSANAELTDFLAKEKLNSQGGGSQRGGGVTYNITLQAGGLINANDMKAAATALVKEIRQMSERGTPVISSKGIV